MNKYLKIIVLIITMLIHSIGLIYSQTEQYNFRHLTTEDGLPSNYTWSIMQDSKGFMWFTTRAGLCRYDGYNVRVYQYEPDDTTSISDIYVKSTITEDTNGFIWVGSRDGLNKFDPVTEKFYRYYPSPDDSTSISSRLIRCTYIDRQGIVWIGTNGGGLNRYDEKTDRFISYLPNPDYKFSNTIRGIYDDGSGNLWIGTGNGLYRFEKKTGKFTLLYKLSDIRRGIAIRFITFAEDKTGKLWICADKIYTYDKVSGKIVPFEAINIHLSGTSNPKYMSIFLDTSNVSSTLWIVKDGLFKYELKSKKLLNVYNDPEHPERYIGSNPRAFCMDASGMMWVAATSGITIFNPGAQQVETHAEFFDTYQFNAQSFLRDSNGDFWIGGSGGVVHFDEQMNMVRWYKSITNSQYTNALKGNNEKIFEDSNHNIWLVRSGAGIYLLDKTKNEFILCKLMRYGKEATPNNLYDIYEEAGGTIWVSSDGLFERNPDTEIPDIFYLDTSNTVTEYFTITRVTEDQSGNLWISSNTEGLYCQPLSYRGTNNFIRYLHQPGNPHSLSNSHVWCVYSDYNGNVWAGTNQGLNKYVEEKDHFERYLMDAEGGASFIYDILMDNNGYLWMTTEHGLIGFDPTPVNQPDKQEGRGKQHLTFDQAFNGQIYQDNSGIIYVGSTPRSNEGYYCIYPDFSSEKTLLPPLVITDFNIRNEAKSLDSSISIKKHMVLKHSENFFSFEFAALDYTDPAQNQYAYMLEGMEEEWNYSGTRKFANYTGVPFGNYIFRIKGSNSDGFWNETGTSIAITILPPPWKTWWAYTLYVLFSISLIVFVLRFYLRRQRLLHNLELEQVQTEKLEELDKMKSRFFENISHEFRTPLILILGPIDKLRSFIKDKEPKKDLDMMQHNANRLQRLINQLLNLSKIESGKMKLQVREENIISLVNGYVQSFESLAKQKKIDLIFHSTEKNIKLYIDKDQIEKILYNLLSNAFKFTGEGGEIVVEVTPLNPPLRGDSPASELSSLEGGRWVKITISDTGCGIPPEKLDHIFNRFYQTSDSYTREQEGTGIGLALTKELVRLHHGEISVESQVGKGSTFTVILPAGKEHFKPGEILAEAKAGTSVEAIPDQYPELATHAEKSKTDTSPYDESKPILLIVEDNADLLSYIRGNLDSSYFVLEARDGEEGLKEAIKNIPDLVLSDVMMPKMDGFELCQKLKTDERTSHIPVILLTARASLESKIEGLETGADDYISKPFDPTELKIRIKNLILQRQKLREKFTSDFWKENKLPVLQSVASGLNQMDKKFLQKALDIVNKHLSDTDFNVVELGREMAMSRQQMHRKFRALVNQSATEFIRTIRLIKAAEFLSQKSGSVSEIAFDVGFNTLSYFTKCFQEYFGVTPSEYLSKIQD